MYVLGDRWQEGYLDYHLGPGEVRVAVAAWCTLEKLSDVFLEQPRTLRRLHNYAREIGLRAVWHKVRSRLGERVRDRRFLSIGAGSVVEGEAAGLAIGTPVAFLAPCHPECVERLALPAAFLRPLASELLERLRVPQGIRLFRRHVPEQPPDFSAVAGWSRFAGDAAEAGARNLLSWVERELGRLEPARAEILPLPRPSELRERSSALGASGDPRAAVLFGLGNYAKTVLLPNLDRRLTVRCVHEIDPTQIGVVHGTSPAYDTSETLRPDERYGTCFVAGYHHTHAQLALRALRSGAYAVVEKPLVTTRAQLEDLLKAVRERPGRLFAGFHMRYNPLWQLARKDLRAAPGDPIHYQCIVFEIPLVRHHWYNWPNSGSRIVSNGCHWLDHFLFMNDFARPIRQQLLRSSNGDLHCSVDLENGACFSMVLTEHGSRRIGVQDHVELRLRDVTVRVDNGARYAAESSTRILRRKRVNSMVARNRMYRAISRAIIEGHGGDSLESIERSSELMLSLEDMHRDCLVAVSRPK